MKKISLLYFLCAILLFGCSGFEDQEYNSNITESDIRKSNLEEEDKELLLQAIERTKNEGTDLTGIAIKDIIADQAARNVTLFMKDMERNEQIKELFKVTLDNKSVISLNTNSVNFDLTFTNSSDYQIRAFKGVIVFKDIFGDEFKRINLEYDQTISGGSFVEWNGEYKVNPTVAEDIKLRDTDFENLQYDFQLTTVILDNGTRINF